MVHHGRSSKILKESRKEMKLFLKHAKSLWKIEADEDIAEGKKRS